MCRVMMMVAGGLLAILITALATIMIVRTYNPSQLCSNKHDSLGFTQIEKWDDTEKIDIPSKNLVISRTVSSARCYITPKYDHNDGKIQAVKVLPERLSKDMIQYIAGTEAASLCGDFDTYLAVPLQQSELTAPRRKRAPPAAARDIPYEQRQPNCMNLLLLCPDNIGQVQSCYTWINGVIWMDRKCTDETHFQIKMTKPPGRILKVLQEETRECNLRRQKDPYATC